MSNNLWTLGQQYVVYRRIDAEQAEKKEQTVVNRQALAPRPGQKPVRPEVKPEAEAETPEPEVAAPPAKKPGAKPVARKQPPASAKGSTNGVAKTNGTGKNGSGGTAGAGSSGAGATPGARRPRKRR